jgi:hypothetical protein
MTKNPVKKRKPRCCVCLCVYNNERGLVPVLNNANKLSSIFDDLKILVFYDHSTDNSLQILEIYNSKYKNMVIKVNPAKISVSLVENIAYARNGLLEIIRNKYANYEYFIMMDSNEYSCIGSINLDVISEMLERNDEWDSISFDREAGYYDYWALSYDPFIYSFFHFDNNFKTLYQIMKNDFEKKLAEKKSVNPNELISVYSAFNGCALYKCAKFLNCSYNSNIDLNLFPSSILQKNIESFGNISQKMAHDCEHRQFHLEAIAKNNAKIRISTKSLFKKVENPPNGLRGPC